MATYNQQQQGILLPPKKDLEGCQTLRMFHAFVEGNEFMYLHLWNIINRVDSKKIRYTHLPINNDKQ